MKENNSLSTNRQINNQSPAMQENSTPSIPQSSQSSKKDPKIFVGLLLLLLIVIGGAVFSIMQSKQQTKNPVLDEEQIVQQEGTDKLQGTGSLSEVKEVDPKSDSAGEVHQEDLPPATSEMTAPAVQDATLSISSNKTTYAVGDQLTAKVMLEVGQQPDGVEFVLTFDPVKLTNVQVQEGNVFTTYLKTNVYQDKGKVKVVVIVNPEETIDVSQPIEVITLTGTTSGTGVLELGFDKEQTLVAANWGKDILKSANSLQVQVK